MKSINAVYVERNLMVLAFLKETDAPCGYYYDEEIHMHTIWAKTETGYASWHVDGWYIPDWLNEKKPDQDSYSDLEKNRRIAELVDIETGFQESSVVKFGDEFDEDPSDNHSDDNDQCGWKVLSINKEADVIDEGDPCNRCDTKLSIRESFYVVEYANGKFHEVCSNCESELEVGEIDNEQRVILPDGGTKPINKEAKQKIAEATDTLDSIESGNILHIPGQKTPVTVTEVNKPENSDNEERLVRSWNIVGEDPRGWNYEIKAQLFENGEFSSELQCWNSEGRVSKEEMAVNDLKQQRTDR